ncbi:hypothetical protein BBJ28_00006059 [Nothophytophthora sp. Chile5]|nr:hypothetical protein BBJ28_00006059 [Nothophytophthora sp. Chile5]
MDNGASSPPARQKSQFSGPPADDLGLCPVLSGSFPSRQPGEELRSAQTPIWPAARRDPTPISMGCSNSKDVQEPRASAPPAMRPSTPSFRAKDSALWTSASDSRANEFREELPSFVVSDSAELVGSSDGEAVHGMVSAFTFSFIQVSEAGSNSSSLGGMGLESPAVDAPVSESDDSAAATAPPESQQSLGGDAVELTPIPEENTHSGPREDLKSSRSTAGHSPLQTERPAASIAEPRKPEETMATEGAAVEPETETPPSDEQAVAQVVAGVVDATAAENAQEPDAPEAGDVLEAESDASSTSRRSVAGSSATGDTRRSVATSEFSEGGEYMVTETGAVVRHESPAALEDEFSAAETAKTVVQRVIGGAVSNVTHSTASQQPHDRAAPMAMSSLEVEPPSSGAVARNLEMELLDVPPLSAVPTGWTYCIVGTSTENGVVLYQIQLTDEVGDNAKWPAPLQRRYSSFSEMYAKLRESKTPATESLPALPRAGVLHFVRGRQSKRTIEERQRKFSEVLRYIAQHRELHESAEFQSFLGQ